MSTSAQQTAPDVQLKVVTVNKKQSHKTSNRVASSKIFNISFSYLNKSFRTKVMKVIYADNNAMYKIVLHSSINNGECVIYWLQRDDSKWAVLMGAELDAKLFKAVTMAIDCME